MKLRSSLLAISTLLVVTCAYASDCCQTKHLSNLPNLAQAKISAAVGRDIPDYQVRAIGNSFEVINPHANLTVRFTSSGVEITSGKMRLGMILRGYGYECGNRLKPRSQASPRADWNRVEYRRGSVTEWYVNGPAGLEQGFTFDRPPANCSGRTLTIALGLSGDLTAVSDENRTGLTFTDRGGVPVLRYAGLSARDDDGRDLRASLEVRDEELLISVDALNARYPLLIDPMVQLAELTSSDGASGDRFGSSVAISGNTVVVGAPNATVNSNMYAGAVYVFTKPTTGWQNMTQIAKLTATDGAYAQFFGEAVSVSGNTIAATAPASFGHAAYVFVEPSTGWTDMTETAELTAGNSGDYFGCSLALQGSTVVVGARNTNDELGAVYIFLKPASGWQTTSQYTAELTPSDGQGGFFGQAVSTDGNAIAVGAPLTVVTGNESQGATFVFVKPETGWVTTSNFAAELTISSGAINTYFGDAVSIEGSTVVVGAPSASGVNMDQGAAYVFAEPATGWTSMTETAELTAPDGTGGQLGVSVSITGNIVVVGANGANTGKGAAAEFVKPPGGWVSTSIPNARLTASDGAANDSFGLAVATGKGVILVGSPFTQVGTSQPGTAYIFGP